MEKRKATLSEKLWMEMWGFFGNFLGIGASEGRNVVKSGNMTRRPSPRPGTICLFTTSSDGEDDTLFANVTPPRRNTGEMPPFRSDCLFPTVGPCRAMREQAKNYRKKGARIIIARGIGRGKGPV